MGDTPHNNNKESVKISPATPETSPQLKQKYRDKPTVKLKQEQKTQLAPKLTQMAPKPKLAIPVTEESTDINLGLNVEGKGEEDNARKTIIPNRPTLTKAKKGSKWEEEEEDTSEVLQKNAKSIAKAKRLRVKSLLEDEDEELAELLNKPAPVTMSLSLARPTKPKSFAEKNKSQSSSNTSNIKKKSNQSLEYFKPESSKQTQPAEVKSLEKLVINTSMTVQELALALAVPETEIIRRL